MRVTVDQIDLSNTLQKLQSITPVRTADQMSILQNVLLEATKKGLYCTTTNGEVASRVYIDAIVEEEGKTTTPCRGFAKLAKTLNRSNQVELELLSNDRLQVLSGKGKYKLPCLDAEEFMKMPNSKNITFRIPSGILRAALEDTIFAASTEEVRYILNGVCLTFKDGTIEFAATDVKKVAVTVYDADFEGEVNQIVIPLKACNEIRNIFTNDEEIAVCVEDSFLTFSTDTYHFFARTVSSSNSSYPNYNQLFAFEDEKVVLANKDQLEAAIKRVSSIKQDSYTINLLVNEEENTLDVSAQTGDYDFYEQVDLDGKTANLDFQVNFKFLSDVLEHLNCENIMISMAPDNHRIALKCADNKNQYYMIALVKNE